MGQKCNSVVLANLIDYVINYKLSQAFCAASLFHRNQYLGPKIIHFLRTLGWVKNGEQMYVPFSSGNCDFNAREYDYTFSVCRHF